MILKSMEVQKNNNFSLKLYIS